jgi:predicted nucleotidyltransferase
VIDFRELIRSLSTSGVEFIIVGGFAATAHGAARSTSDLDIVYRRADQNLEKLVEALRPLKPYLRGAPPGLPFVWDLRTMRSGLNFTLTTTVGDIDLLGEVIGGGSFEDLLPSSVELHLFGFVCHCLGLERLIHVKRAAGRPKDLEAIAELEALLEERISKDL